MNAAVTLTKYYPLERAKNPFKFVNTKHIPQRPNSNSRIHFSSALYHITLRGNAGHPVFFDDADHCRYYLLIQEVAVIRLPRPRNWKTNFARNCTA
jgi:hypothetical protein